MSDDLAGALVLWFVMVLGVAIAIPIVAAIAVVALVGLGLWQVLGVACDLARGDPLRRELREAIRERNRAVADIVALRNQGLRRMLAIADEDVTEGTAEEWES